MQSMENTPVDLGWVAEDPFLAKRVMAAAEAMGVSNLQDLIVSHARFDHPGTVEDRDGTSRETTHYRLEQLLGIMPDYMTNARQAGLSPDQAYSLVHTLLTAEGRNKWAANDEPVARLSGAFAYRAERHEVLSNEEYGILHTLIADVASREDDSRAVLGAYRALTRLGFSSAESDRLIREELYTDALVVDYAVEAFHALSIATVDPGLLTDICRLIHGEKPRLHDIQASYLMLKDLITIICPSRDIPPHDLLVLVRDRLAEGRPMATLRADFTGGQPAIAGGASVQIGAIDTSQINQASWIYLPSPIELNAPSVKARQTLAALPYAIRDMKRWAKVSGCSTLTPRHQPGTHWAAKRKSIYNGEPRTSSIPPIPWAT
jgi:hypothetical protein